MALAAHRVASTATTSCSTQQRTAMRAQLCSTSSSAPRRSLAGRALVVTPQAPSSRSAPVVRVAVQDGNIEAEAETRWGNQVRDGKVKNVSAADAGQLMQDGWVMLDVRPPNEVERVAIEGAVAVPLFVPDPARDLGAFIKAASAFGLGGWWLGGTHMIPNSDFMKQVNAAVPRDAKVIVGCQKGLRSLAACEQLSRAGYGTIAWVNGGYDTAKVGDLPTANNQDIRYAGIGGVSEMLGWTEVQQEEKKSFAGGYENVLKVVGVVLALDAAVFLYEYITVQVQGKPNPFA